ncbi:MAG: HAD-IIIC family phosphatase [Methylocella sp.]
MVSASRQDIDYAGTIRLDRFADRVFGPAIRDRTLNVPCVRLAVLSTSTSGHLLAGIRVAGLARGLWIETYEPAYGQIWQEINDKTSGLHRFDPNVVLFAHDAGSLFGGQGDNLLDASDAVVDARLDQLRTLWRHAKSEWEAAVLQQIPLNTMLRLMGENEHRLPGSPTEQLNRFTAKLRGASVEDGVDLIDLDHWVGRYGLAAWHDQALWHRAKQEIGPAATPVYGDLVARVIAARYGRSAKCLVLDLDNTLWGGVVGDDGLAGIVLGQGSATGEAFLAFQSYVKQLSRRGIILAVCSKNDEAIARSAFEKHPEMILRSSDIACFVANWTDKASNLRYIAKELNIGIDALVFADDSPFERNLVRTELAAVLVPELGDDPTFYPSIIADSGLFEGVAVTSDDVARSAQYQENNQRQALLDASTDLDGYLKALEMTLKFGPFDDMGLQRIVQLINKTNQFNLTTRRYTEAEVRSIMSDPDSVTLQLRLTDKFGDNGIIAVLILRPNETAAALKVETWLMSCRVLGRQVEQAAMNLIADVAKARGYRSLIGEYRPTERNEIVREHYSKLGFSVLSDEGSLTTLQLRLEGFVPYQTHMEIGRLP